MHTLFISKEVAETSVLRTFCEEYSITIHSHSFLTFQPIPLHWEITSHALFFTSKRAVSYFFNQYSSSPKWSIACVGQATADEVLRRGLNVDFIASNSGKPTDVAHEVANWLAGKSITFVSALKSINSIIDLLPSSQVDQVAVYETQITPFQLHTSFDVYVFTSPSNLEGFLKANILPTAAKLIAWGETTAAAMREQGLEPLYTLKTSSEKELVDYLLEIGSEISNE
jgi:uroporphyrinogen-III synthase